MSDVVNLIVAFAAHLNRCLFWFHPLAWWLERTLATTAEQVADEEAIAVLGSRTAYAGILLDMARAVAPAGGRVAWRGVGIGGSGVLHERIPCARAATRRCHAAGLRSDPCLPSAV